jgi:cytochrome c1
MKNILIYLGLILAVVALYGFAFTFAADEGPDGKQIFTDKKCMSCHSVESLEISATKKSGVVDLSNVGNEVENDFLLKYLMKEEKLNDKAHPTKFNGTDEEYKALIDWLLTLKAEE